MVYILLCFPGRRPRALCIFGACAPGEGEQELVAAAAAGGAGAKRSPPRVPATQLLNGAGCLELLARPVLRLLLNLTATKAGEAELSLTRDSLHNPCPSISTQSPVQGTPWEQMGVGTHLEAPGSRDTADCFLALPFLLIPAPSLGSQGGRNRTSSGYRKKQQGKLRKRHGGACLARAQQLGADTGCCGCRKRRCPRLVCWEPLCPAPWPASCLQLLGPVQLLPLSAAAAVSTLHESSCRYRSRPLGWMESLNSITQSLPRLLPCI